MPVMLRVCNRKQVRTTGIIHHFETLVIVKYFLNGHLQCLMKRIDSTFLKCCFSQQVCVSTKKTEIIIVLPLNSKILGDLLLRFFFVQYILSPYKPILANYR